MKIHFDSYHQPKPAKIYLGSPNNKIICELNGIDENSVELKPILNNAYELRFKVNRYIIINGQEVESNAYNLLDMLMRIYVENVGWFLMRSPEISNDGIKETKSVSAESIELEMQQYDIKGLKINKGTTDSYEMLVDGNVDIIDDVEFAKEQIKFYNKTKPELSFLHILMKVTGLYGWKIGYIDDIPHVYKYYDNGELKQKHVMLSDEVGSFDIDTQDLYSFLTQDAAQFFNCVFIFDINNLTINVYRPENIGKDTNINIGFRNLQQSNEISVDTDNVFTRYTVYGSDDLGISYVNFGSNVIENLDYFLNEKFLPGSTITKYKIWKNDVELERPLYIEQTRLYNNQLSVISELKNRVPLDGCSTEWNKFEDDKLLEAQANYQAQLKGYEDYYVDAEGNFDQDALNASSDANDYYQIKDVILPSIQIEINNRNLPPNQDPEDYIKSFETDWKLYGLDELQVKLDAYKNIKKICEDSKYNVPYASESGHTEDMHNEMYQKYLDAVNQLDGSYVGSCQEAYNQRQLEVESATLILNQYKAEMQKITDSVQKETWTNGDITFLLEDLEALSKIYIDCDYTNDNMFLTSSDDAMSAIDEQLKLFSSAEEDLEKASRPQYTYTTSLDNFLALYDYKHYTDNLNLGDFVYLGVRNDYVVKLRVVSMTYNPMIWDNNLQITFSNMIQSRAERTDIAYFFDSNTRRSKSSSSGNSNDYLSNEGITLTSGLLQKLLQSGSFSNKVNQMINNEFAGYVGKMITVKNLNAEMIKATDIIGHNGFFEYLQSKLISAGHIVGDSADFKELQTLVGYINTLLSGTVSSELGHIIKLTAENVSIDEAVIRDIIAANITVGMLKAGNISSDSFNVVSDDGGLQIAGNTMQFKDKNDIVRIQIGRDAQNNFSFTLYDESGTGVLIDSTGVKKSAISDGLIVNDMLANQTITKDKLGFKIIETDENGKVNATNILINGQGLDVKFNTMEETIENISMTAGTGIDHIDVLYYVSDLSTELSGGVWSTERPAWESNKYIWSKTIYYLTNDTTQESNPACITGNHGETGKGISSITPEFYLSTSIGTPVGGNWSKQFPTWLAETYLWRRFEIIYQNPISTEYTTPIFDSTWNELSDIKSDIDSITTTVSEVSTKVDNNTKSIELKASQSDITNAINFYDGSTVKIIRDQVAIHTTEIGKIKSDVTDITSSVEDKADGATVQALTEKMSSMEQDANGFKSEVSSKYATKTENNAIKNDLASLSGSVASWTNNITDELEDMQNQIDGAIETWFYTPSPSLTNAPANIWTTTALKNAHLGDLYYDGSGFCYRFQMDDSTYKWVRIKDSDVTKALSDAANAQNTANIKRRVFVSTPAVPYDAGDLWLNNKELYRCKITKLSGSYASTDWENAVKYTDDTKANQVASDLSNNYSTTTQMNSAIIQKANEITQSVASTYETKTNVAKISVKADKIEQTVSSHTGDISTLKQTATSYGNRITNAEGSISSLKQTADSLGVSISKKKDTLSTSIRYIRDWLNGSSANVGNHWVECRVMADGVNISGGLTPTAKDANLNNITLTDIALYTNDNTSASPYISGGSGWKCIQLDLGSVRKDIDYIQIWHYYTDNRVYNHKLQVSADGTNWITLYDSTFSGGYAESENGRMYIINESYIDTNFTEFKVDINGIRQSITDVDGKINTVESTANGTKQTVTKVIESIDTIDDSVNKISDNYNSLNKSFAEYKVTQEVTAQGIKEQIQTVEKNGNERLSTVERSVQSFDLNFSEIGMNSSQQSETNIQISKDGIVVLNKITGQKTMITTDMFGGYYNNENVFSFNQDLMRTKRIYVERGIDTGAIKYVPVTYVVNGVTIKGVVHIKSGGTS